MTVNNLAKAPLALLLLFASCKPAQLDTEVVNNFYFEVSSQFVAPVTESVTTSGNIVLKLEKGDLDIDYSMSYSNQEWKFSHDGKPFESGGTFRFSDDSTFVLSIPHLAKGTYSFACKVANKKYSVSLDCPYVVEPDIVSDVSITGIPEVLYVNSTYDAYVSYSPSDAVVDLMTFTCSPADAVTLERVAGDHFKVKTGSWQGTVKFTANVNGCVKTVSADVLNLDFNFTVSVPDILSDKVPEVSIKRTKGEASRIYSVTYSVDGGKDINQVSNLSFPLNEIYKFSLSGPLSIGGHEVKVTLCDVKGGEARTVSAKFNVLPIPVQKIELFLGGDTSDIAGKTVKMNVGETKVLSYRVIPSNAYVKSVKVESSSASRVSVAPGGTAVYSLGGVKVGPEDIVLTVEGAATYTSSFKAEVYGSFELSFSNECKYIDYDQFGNDYMDMEYYYLTMKVGDSRYAGYGLKSVKTKGTIVGECRIGGSTMKETATVDVTNTSVGSLSMSYTRIADLTKEVAAVSKVNYYYSPSQGSEYHVFNWKHTDDELTVTLTFSESFISKYLTVTHKENPGDFESPMIKLVIE